MKIAFYTICPSPHQFPLAEEIISRVGEENFRYVYVIAWLPRFANAKPTEDDLKLPRWCVSDKSAEGKAWLDSAEVLVSGERDVALFERRAQAGLKTIYSAERWFKPPVGFLRMLHPRYFAMAWRFARLVRRGAVTCLPMGVWSARDLARIERLFRGDVRCLFCAPRLAFEPKPMGAVEGFPWMRMWGYFVAARAAATGADRVASERGVVRVLWVGRFVDWKRVETIVRAVYAVRAHAKASLTLVGAGPERARLGALDEHLAQVAGCVPHTTFCANVPGEEVRRLMRAHDVYVLSSDGGEGWGAVVNEALEEGMEVFGTDAAGSSATILPRENQFAPGDWRTLARLLERFAQTGERHCHGIGAWSPANAAEALLSFMI